MNAPALCAKCVSRTSVVVRSGDKSVSSERCAHPENQSGFSRSGERQAAGRYRTHEDMKKAKGAQA